MNFHSSHVTPCCRYTRIMNIMNNWEGVPILFVAANWLVYLNSSLNPVIYNFMSGEQQRNINHVNETATLMT